MRSVPIILFAILMAAGNLFAQSGSSNNSFSINNAPLALSNFEKNMAYADLFNRYTKKIYTSESCPDHDKKASIVSQFHAFNPSKIMFSTVEKVFKVTSFHAPEFSLYLQAEAAKRNCIEKNPTPVIAKKDSQVIESNASTCTANKCSAPNTVQAVAPAAGAAVGGALNKVIEAIPGKSNAQANETKEKTNTDKKTEPVPAPAPVQTAVVAPKMVVDGDNSTITYPDGSKTITNKDGDQVLVQKYDARGKRIEENHYKTNMNGTIDIDAELSPKLKEHMDDHLFKPETKEQKIARKAEEKKLSAKEKKDRIANKKAEKQRKADEKDKAAEEKQNDLSTEQYETFKANISSVQLSIVSHQHVCDEVIKARIELIKSDLITINAAADDALVTQNNCNGASTKADIICPIATNPAVTTTSLIMNGLTIGVNSTNSAKETCELVNSANSVGQSVILVGTAACAGTKLFCEAKCAKTNARIGVINTKVLAQAKLLTTLQSEIQADIQNPCKTGSEPLFSEAIINLTKNAEILVPQLETNTERIGRCNGYKVDIQQMASTAAGMFLAATQGKSCANKLDASGGSGGGSAITTTQMCADPANANSVICKCRADNTVAGCPGNIGAAIANSNLDKELGTKGSSNMAGGQFGKPFSGKGVNTDSGLEGISDEAKKVLSGGSEAASAGSEFGTATAANSGGGSGSGGSGSQTAAGKSKEESKSLMGSFSSAIGSFFKGGSSKSNDSKIDKLNSDKYKENIKRQIAAEQARGEISSASGTDNWTKVKTRYKSNSNTLIENN